MIRDSGRSDCGQGTLFTIQKSLGLSAAEGWARQKGGRADHPLGEEAAAHLRAAPHDLCHLVGDRIPELEAF